MYSDMYICTPLRRDNSSEGLYLAAISFCLVGVVCHNCVLRGEILWLLLNWGCMLIKWNSPLCDVFYYRLKVEGCVPI